MRLESKSLRALYTLTLFLSSGLLFLVQPMVAKMILPRFGGSPAVWTTSMLFFQVLLLLGYAYAHSSVKWLGARRQAVLHIVLLVAAALLTRLALPAGSGTSSSAGQVLLVLTLMVGAPFFVLSAGAPLIQRWFASTTDPAAKDPYFLYSASNLGSMLALLAYPLIFEPRLRLGDQGQVWTYALYALLALMALCAISLTRAGTPGTSLQDTAERHIITRKQRLEWIALAAVPSSLLLGVTNYMTTNLAPMPLLWVVPLALYLLTFIVAFARRPIASSKLWARFLPLAVTPLVLVMILESSEPMPLLITMHLIGFTMAALMCHTRLVETRPPAGQLTEFYVWLSVGGAVGGLFNALVAPTIFNTLAEYPIALVAACLLRRGKEPSWKLDWAFAAGMLILTIGLAMVVKMVGLPPTQARTGIVIGLPAILCFLMVDYPVRYALMVGALFLGSNIMQTSSAGEIAYTGRSFFGVHRVVYMDNDRFHELVHGNTTHGIQDMQNLGEPKTYYTRSGPIGDVFTAYPEAKDVALVGMGIGSCAAYGQAGQRMTYFEIDPVVDKIARDPKHFTFLRDTKADLNVVLGDARLTLGADSGTYDLIVLDAFSSDSIPIHLLTREAVSMYRSKLREGGVLAFHISNRYLHLEPILANVAKSLGLRAYMRDDAPTDEEYFYGKRQSRWVAMAESEETLKPLIEQHFWSEAQLREGTPLWTDDYSNIISAFKRKEDE